MIHEIGVELQAILTAQGCPFPVVDGPERLNPTTWASERIVIEHDDAGDSFGSAVSQHLNPKMRGVRTIGVKVTIYAQEPADNASLFEHNRRAEHALDLVLSALASISSTRKNKIVPKSGKFTQPADLKASDVPAGAVYELMITVDRGVFDRPWSGAALPTFVPTTGKITSTTQVSLANGPALNETGCG